MNFHNPAIVHQTETLTGSANPFDDRPHRLRSKMTGLYLLLAVANVGAWAWAWIAFAGYPVLMGTALLAYMFGLRHAFDADHIAAIDNVVRKLMQENKAPISAGFFFSLGHSTIVVLASVGIAASTAMMHGRLTAFREVGGVIGTSVSALFLLIIGLANLIVLRSIWRSFRRVRHGEQICDADLGGMLAGGGFFARLFRPLFAMVSRSWHLYPIGFLFGLGFDTATEIGLLGISAAQAAQGVSFWSILIFPALFTAGMSLMDTTDSVFMTGAYGWAFVKPIRKLWYNLTITAASVLVALFIGGIEAFGLLREKLGASGPLWNLVDRLNSDLTDFGFAVIGIFLVSWLVSTAIYRLKSYDAITIENTR